MLSMFQCRGVVAKLTKVFVISYSTNSTNGDITTNFALAPKPPTWLGYNRTPRKPVGPVSFKTRLSNARASLGDFVDQKTLSLANSPWYNAFAPVMAVATLAWGFRWFYRRRCKASLERQAAWNELFKIRAIPLHLSRV